MNKGDQTEMNPRSVDAITLSTIWHTFQSTCREMRHVLDRTAQSLLMAQLHDVAAGIWAAQAHTPAATFRMATIFTPKGSVTLPSKSSRREWRERTSWN